MNTAAGDYERPLRLLDPLRSPLYGFGVPALPLDLPDTLLKQLRRIVVCIGLDVLRQEYPEAFSRLYDKASGLALDRVLAKGGR